MELKIEDLILNKIKTYKKGWIFCTNDFLEISNYKAVSKCLERMTNKKIVKRILRGIYMINNFNNFFNLEEEPNIDEVCQCIARKNGWKIIPTGNVALNILGLSTQVPSNYEYLSNGPYKKYEFGNVKITFKHTLSKYFAISEKTMLIIQALKAIGEENIAQIDIVRLTEILSGDDKSILTNEQNSAPIWMHKHIKDITGGINVAYTSENG